MQAKVPPPPPTLAGGPETTQSRSRLVAIVAAVVAGLLVAGAGAFLLARPTGKSRERLAEDDRLLAEAPGAGVDSGCGAVVTVPPYSPASEDRSHVVPAQFGVPPALSSYPSVPPASGPHEPVPFPAGVYPQAQDIYRMLHSLEHGAVIIWYDPASTSAELTQIKAFYSKRDEMDHVIVAPYDYPSEGEAGHLRSGIQMVVVAWHHMQFCQRASLAVSYGFVSDFRLDAGHPESYKGDAPEAGVSIG
jgi:hypothetical protein